MSEVPTTPPSALPQLVTLVFNQLLDGLQNHLAHAGYEDVRPTHFTNVFQFLDCNGTRPTVLARRAGISPQAMSELITYLEGCGYVQRVSDPDDRRGRIVMLAERGREAATCAAAYYADLESHWTALMGREHLQQVTSGLVRMLDKPGHLAGQTP